ncbi:MAG TPA: hypothetical protein DHU93_06570, partial [Algoriphagus sp.]|nr:hypothetical protein [Algoriphagus sp.]
PTTMTMQFAPRRYVGSSYGAPGETEERLYQHAKESAEEAFKVLEEFMSGEWKAFEEKVKNTPVNLFEGVKEK